MKMTEEDYNFFDFTDLTEKQIRKYIKKFGDDDDFWNVIAAYQTLSESFIREFANKICWQNVTTCQDISEEFMDEFKDKIDWNALCRWRRLNNTFMDKHADKIDWFRIVSHQRLEEWFIEKHIDKLNFEKVLEYQQVSEDFIKRHKDKWIDKNSCLNNIRAYQNPSPSFIKEITRQQQYLVNKWAKEELEKRKKRLEEDDVPF